jgi:long-chain acyl-CoA synthetase
MSPYGDGASDMRTPLPSHYYGRGELLYADEPRTLPELFLKAANDFNRKDALSYKRGGEWRHISSTEMISRSQNIARGLYSLGLRKGDRAAIISANSPEWTLADAGCQFAGIIDVPVYTTLTSESIAYILNDSGARVFFIQNRELYEHVREILPECASVERLVFFEYDDHTVDNAMTITELEKIGEKLGAEQPDLLSSITSSITPEDLATLIYTSGTTGEPKGVMLTQCNIVSNALDCCAGHEFAPDDISISVLPLSHVFERTGMYVYIRNGMAVYFAESIDKVPDNLQEIRPTIFIGVPRIFEKVYAKAKLKAAQAGGKKEKVFDWAIDVAKEYALVLEKSGSVPFTLAIKHKLADVLVYSKLREFFGGRLRFCITGGAALSDDIFLIFTGAGISILQGYGLTETSPVITSSYPEAKRLGTVGKPIRNTQIRIASDGEIEARGPSIMVGYYHKPEATREAFTEDGWFKTGDIGEIEADGYLRITDRKKELFKTSGGKYIAPTKIEQMIRSSRFVSQVVLIGSERKFPAALIVPNFEMLESYAQHKGLPQMTPAESCSSERINDLFRRQIDRVTDGLAQFEKVKKFVLLKHEMTVEGGELTPTLKVKRRVVDKKYNDVIDEMYRE